LGRPCRYGPLARLILDTTALIDAERGSIGELDELIGDQDDVAIASISVAELAVGAELADGKRRAERGEFVDAVLEAFVVESYDVDVALAHGALLAHTRHSGRPRGAHDLIIAATAQARRREVVSADRDGFSELPGVKLRNL
jgi:tRNA(fMet)-specific endonuclease VapC